MKKIIALILSISMLFALSACGGNSNENNSANNEMGSESNGAAAETSDEGSGIAEGKTLVVYYSATGNTKEVANYIAEAAGADLFELTPVDSYTDEDLDWTDSGSRVVYEHENPEARAVELVESAANDFTGKTVIPFCTSASSGLGESGELLAEAAGTGNWLEGMRFRSSASQADVEAWVEELGIAD